MALDVELGAGVNLVFSTPVLVRRMNELMQHYGLPSSRLKRPITVCR